MGLAKGACTLARATISGAARGSSNGFPGRYCWEWVEHPEVIAAAIKHSGKEDKRMSDRIPTFGVPKSLQNAWIEHSQNALSKFEWEAAHLGAAYLERRYW